MNSPVVISVAPNGARKTKSDHPKLPLTSAEIAREAKLCHEAGATLLHLHVRDKRQAHTLDPEIYLAAIEKVKSAVGAHMIIQITTESIGKYSPEEQIDCVKKVNPDAVSVAIKELIPDPKAELQAARFFEWMALQGVAPQYILYSEEEINRFNSLWDRGIIQSDNPNVLLVLGKYNEAQESMPERLHSLLSAMRPTTVWSACAFGQTEAECMSKVIALGGHCRVGFENNVLNNSGELASGNAQQIASLCEEVARGERSVAQIHEARLLFGAHRE